MTDREKLERVVAMVHRYMHLNRPQEQCLRCKQLLLFGTDIQFFDDMRERHKRG